MNTPATGPSHQATVTDTAQPSIGRRVITAIRSWSVDEDDIEVIVAVLTVTFTAGLALAALLYNVLHILAAAQ